MTELKTLNDCIKDNLHFWDDNGGLEPEALKQEAINDIKELRLCEENDKNEYSECKGKYKDFADWNSDSHSHIGVINYIKWKFNLTEEDLK